MNIFQKSEREIAACIGCNECLRACPAIAEPIPIHKSRDAIGCSIYVGSTFRPLLLSMWGLHPGLSNRTSERSNDAHSKDAPVAYACGTAAPGAATLGP